MRDASIAGLAAVLLALAVSASAGLLAAPSAAALTVTYAAFHLVVLLPSLRDRSTIRVFVALAVALPFAWALDGATPAGLVWPIAPVALAAFASLLGSRAGPRVRGVVGAAFAVVFAAGPLLDATSTGPVPRVLRLPTSALAARGASLDRSTHARHDAVPGAELVRAGALVPRATAAALGVDLPVVAARWTAAPAGVVGGVPSGAISVRVVGSATGRRSEGRFVLVSSPDLPRDARDLDAYDVVLLLETLGRDPAVARTLESFARRGGLLAGPASPAPFGPELERALGSALPDDDGPRGVRSLGAGHVARVARAGGLEDLAAAGLVESRFSSVFDRAVAIPEALRGASENGATPESRLSGSALALLAAFAIASVVASRSPGVRGPVACGALAALVVLGLGLFARADADATAEGFVLDLGGPLGRRVEALRIVAGPRGWRWSEPRRSDEGVRVLGLTATGTGGAEALVLEPGRVAWVVTEAPATGEAGGLAPASTVPDWSIPLLRRGSGRPADVRLFVGEVAFRGVVPGGLRAPGPARILVVAPGRP